MAFEEIKGSLSDAQGAARDYIERTAEYYKLRTFKFVMKVFISMMLAMFLGTLGLLALFFLSVAASVGIGAYMDDPTSGFLIVGAVYLVLGIIAYIFRKKLEAPVLRNFSRHYFEDR